MQYRELTTTQERPIPQKQRKERRMQLQIALSPDAVTERIQHPLPRLAGSAVTDSDTDGTQLLSLSLVIGGEKTRNILGERARMGTRAILRSSGLSPDPASLQCWR